MFGTEEQQRKILEDVEIYNENIESFGRSLGEGMEKLDEHADDMLEKIGQIKKQVNKLMRTIKAFLIIVFFIVILLSIIRIFGTLNW